MNEDIIELHANAVDSEFIKLSDSDAFIYAEQAKENATNAKRSETNSLEYMNIVLQYKQSIENSIANIQNTILLLDNAENIRFYAEDLYNRMYFGEYYDEIEQDYITYTNIQYDENDNLLNHYYRVQEGVDEENNPIFARNSNDEYIFEECAIYKLSNLSNYDDTAILSALESKADINHTHSQYLTSHQDISGKVDKVTGKGLSTEDYTTAEKTKLAGLSNYDDSAILTALAGKSDTDHTHSQYLTSHQSLTNYYTKSEVNALVGDIETILADINTGTGGNS